MLAEKTFQYHRTETFKASAKLGVPKETWKRSLMKVLRTQNITPWREPGENRQRPQKVEGNSGKVLCFIRSTNTLWTPVRPSVIDATTHPDHVVL
jgi:hypothetical protein